jgi:bifunctional glutamyl/prolyl-tRNA synthetase
VVQALLEAAAENLDLKIQSCGDFIRKLKQEKAAKEAVDTEVKVLLLLKDLYKKKTGADWKPKAAEPAKAEKKKEEAKPVTEKADG